MTLVFIPPTTTPSLAAPQPVPNPMEPGIGTITAFANSATTSANQYVSQVINLASDLVAPIIDPVFPVVAGAPVPQVSSPPTAQNAVWSAPGLPVAFTSTLNVEGIMPAPFDDAPPQLVFGSAPTFTEAAPDAPGVQLVYDDPTLSVNLPAPPGLLSVAVVPFSGVNMPVIDENVPILNLAAPSIREYVPGQFYTSALLTATSNSLQDRIVNGGTGLAPSVEQGIWDRGREREYRQVADALDDLERMETLGYALPPGMYLNARVKIQTELGYASFGYNREVAIEQAKLEQSNVLAALQQAVQLESTLINYNNQIEQRIFESSRYATEAGISIYNAQVQAYAAYLDAYKTKIAIYDAKVRGELAKVEAYRAQIAAEQAKAEINTALVNQYRVQADVALSAIEVYKAQIAGIQAKAEIERLKISIFGEQVRAYATKVNAYTADVEGFRASIQAEVSKQEAYRTSVQAYGANVDAAAKQIDAKIAEYRSRLEAKNQEWESYRNAYQAEASRITAIAQSNSSIADIYRAEVAGNTSYNEVLTKQWQVALDQSQRTAEIAINAAKMNSDLFIQTRGIALDATKLGAQVNAQIGAAAINATNYSSSWSNAYSLGLSNSNSDGKNLSQSYAYSTSYSQSDIYQESVSASV